VAGEQTQVPWILQLLLAHDTCVRGLHPSLDLAATLNPTTLGLVASTDPKLLSLSF